MSASPTGVSTNNTSAFVAKLLVNPQKMRLAYFISLTLLGFFSSPAAAAPGYWKPLLSIEEAGLDATGTHNGDLATSCKHTLASPDSSVWNDAGAFLIHKTNKVLDYFIENYSEVFHASPAPKKVLNLKHVDQGTPEGCFIMEDVCFFGMIEILFGMRTSYLRTYEGAEKEEVDELLHSPNLPQEFTEMVRKIDQISAKAFPPERSTVVDYKEIWRESTKLRNLFRLAFLSQVFGGLEWPIPEEPRIEVSDSSSQIKEISQRVKQLSHLHHRFETTRIARLKRRRAYLRQGKLAQSQLP
ncbi:hypothetical protein MJO28_002790 [Puccinia striiformis f. sp. tritici]|uniref:Uncharacterized protein n=2 Tax=Puccinia striiformis TaxID=27350 RepID=A0A2S4WDH3_9BASI|nr:hypothetical protein Pst134EA_005249 [Puccinia striiformis f. sp. tritici]KAH9471350.1 hypothetical protein Pst134EA_005249 [Puccinia striiformis f. sp. tritici]KAI7958999.1 hypothetical protein MJO28_002790 [Puccinia striiformis f. sp. tritici]KAI7964761.1 hypothetical protein MJO29_002859 [Puccinia striiformis f. sp. tritici]POW19757.1 hypothetical protein PSHT_04265 [Puccinia striiformis]